MRTPEDLEVEDAYRFFAPRLAGARRVLDVGCGNGLLARRLHEAGLDVTALDRSRKRLQHTPGVHFVEADLLGFEEAPYDALVFSLSLHHLFPLEQALEAAHRLLTPGGRLLATDFDVEAPDAATARWYYDVEGLLVAAGLYRPEKVAAAEVEDSLLRWTTEHLHTPAFHTGRAMLAGLGQRFTNVGSVPGPFLFRYVARGLVPSPRAEAVTTWALATEERHLATGALRPVGLRLWAQKAS